MREIKRSDEQYREIEAFEDYELTQCVAYEMAFRNPENIEAIEEVAKHYVENKEELKSFYENRTGIGTISFVPILIENYFVGNDLIDFDLPDIYMDKRLNKDFLELIRLVQRDNTISKKDTLINIDKDNEEIGIKNITLRDGYAITQKLTAFYDDEIFTKNDINISDIDPKTIKGMESIINENFKRPKIDVKFQHSLDTALNVNLNRPIEEIIAFVKYVKDDMQKHNLLKSPIELLNIELNRADNLVCKDKKNKCFDARNILSKQQKMADLFFIYDCIKLKYSHTKISHEIYGYYIDQGIKTKTMDANTLRKYKDIAFEYIEQKRYKEMITGIKEKDAFKGMHSDEFYNDENE